jgi:hypothetical protein
MDRDQFRAGLGRLYRGFDKKPPNEEKVESLYRRFKKFHSHSWDRAVSELLCESTFPSFADIRIEVMEWARRSGEEPGQGEVNTRSEEFSAAHGLFHQWFNERLLLCREADLVGPEMAEYFRLQVGEYEAHRGSEMHPYFAGVMGYYLAHWQSGATVAPEPDPVVLALRRPRRVGADESFFHPRVEPELLLPPVV